MPTPYKRARKGRPPSTPEGEFKIQLCAYVDALPGGAAKAAEICGVTKRTINLWRSGKGNPNRATRMGALGLLAVNLSLSPPAPPTE